MKFTEQTANEYSEAWYIKRHCILAMNRLQTVSESVKLCGQQMALFIALCAKCHISFNFFFYSFFFELKTSLFIMLYIYFSAALK